MLNETQLMIAVAGVCVLALVLMVLGRRRRNGQERVHDAVVKAVVVDEPGRLVLARTHDGTQYQGTLAESDEPNTNGAYLSLTGPIVFRRAGGESETMPAAWDRLALPLADVAEVWTRAARAVEPSMPAPSSGTTDRFGGSTAADHGERGTDGGTSDPTRGETRAGRRHARRTNRSAVPTS